MTSRPFARTGAIAACLVALSTLGGCVMDGPGPGTRFASRPNTVEGNWGDPDGIYTARLSNGVLTTIDNSNGATLARGSYAYLDAQNITLNYLSIAKAQQIKANCRLFSPSQLNCTGADGAQFSLFRRAGAV